MFNIREIGHYTDTKIEYTMFSEETYPLDIYECCEALYQTITDEERKELSECKTAEEYAERNNERFGRIIRAFWFNCENLRGCIENDYEEEYDCNPFTFSKIILKDFYLAMHNDLPVWKVPVCEELCEKM